MSTSAPPLRYACLSDIGRLRIGNEDAGHAAPEAGVFVVSDGMGGLPAGAAASQIIVHVLPHLVERRMARLPDFEPLTVQYALTELTAGLSRKMYEQSLVCHGLQGLGATLVALVIRGRACHVLHVGDSRAYLVRRGMILQLTEDHSMVGKLLDQGRLVSEEFEGRHRHLVSQHMAMDRPINPSARTIDLRRGDKLLLCSDGLSGPVPIRQIGRILRDHADPSQACQALIDAANDAGGPDNITALVVHYHGPVTPSAAATPASDLPVGPVTPHPVVGRLHETLLALEKDLQWLQDGSKQTGQASHVRALAAAKRLLGQETFLEYMRRNPTSNPSHAFHQVSTDRHGKWRKQYDRNMATLEPLFAQVTAGDIRLCPIIPNDQTALILRTLWREYRMVERRYFSIRRRDALTREERSLEILIAHLLEGVRTMIGLIQFLPNFVCDA